MGTGIWANFHWESGIWSPGNGNHRQKNNRTGTGIFKIWKNNRLGHGILAKFGLAEMGFIPPLQDPLQISMPF